MPYGDMGFINPTGHMAVYLDHICAEGPLRLRPCRPGEMGVVISRYDGIEHYDWVAVPLVPYLYSVDAVAEIPTWADRSLEHELRDRYRREHLEAIAPDGPDGKVPGGNWYEVVGSAYDRTIYGFQVNSTPEQDADLIAVFNGLPNTEHYNGAFRNCADFARTLVNRLYPHAVRRNFISDLGMTTPKSVARAMVHYSKKHPETGLTIFRIPQVPGTIPRSHDVKGVAESLVKLYGIPLTLLSPPTAIITLVAYIGGGRFHLPKDAPLLEVHDEWMNGVPTPQEAIAAQVVPGAKETGVPLKDGTEPREGTPSTPVDTAAPKEPQLEF
ncbi:hypothetical protein ACFQBQ_17685 [Granulicella cerasi]|uniref:DUF4105 domain-containing protein n=1 Tax=Granulicella cerasi TaxID=741063 RepID=A0ABW1ZD95_9BACT|nr:hypothetical protein [Granulicella cerasi]